MKLIAKAVEIPQKAILTFHKTQVKISNKNKKSKCVRICNNYPVSLKMPYPSSIILTSISMGHNIRNHLDIRGKIQRNYILMILLVKKI